MDFIKLIEEFLTRTQFANYIIASQIPIVACLGIISYIIYKLGFKEFKLISYAWGINLTYLLTNLFLIRSDLSIEVKLLLRTFFDLSTTFIFLIAIIDFIIKYQFPYFRKIPKQQIYVYLILLVFGIGVIKIIPGTFLIYQNINLRFVPTAIFNFLVLFYLSRYFRSLEIKFFQNKYLSFCTLIYALLQFLPITQQITAEPSSFILILDNLSFAFGLLLKMLMLILLARLIIDAETITKSEEKEKLLYDFSKVSSDIHDIKISNPFANYKEGENILINLTLTKILSLLKTEYGYYSNYDEISNQLEIKYASPNYHDKIGYKYSLDISLGGKSVRTKNLQIYHASPDTPIYIKFDGFVLSKNLHSALAIPLILENKAFGVFVIESTEKKYFSVLNIGIVDSLISQMGVAIKNNRLVHEQETSNAFLGSLKHIDRELVADHHKIESVLSYILKNALNLVNCDSGNIDVVKNNKLICVASTNLSKINTESYIDNCLSGLAVLEKKTKYFPDLVNFQKENNYLYSDRIGGDYKCELIVPLIVKDEVIGVFKTESKVINKFSKLDIEKIEGFAANAAIAIYITKLIDDINEKNLALENSIDKRNIDMAFLFGNVINHRIGNSIGTIRTKIKDKLLASQNNDIGIIKYGILKENVIQELGAMLICAEKALDARREISERVNELLTIRPASINFKDIKYRIQELEDFKTNKNISIKINGFENLEPVFISSILLMEVITELIGNAIKSMPDGGDIIVSGKNEDKSININIEDVGCGIDVGDLENIFKRGVSKWRNKAGGGGIGLFEVKRIIEFWGGAISVESKIGNGTKFSINIPLSNKKIIL